MNTDRTVMVTFSQHLQPVAPRGKGGRSESKAIRRIGGLADRGNAIQKEWLRTDDDPTFARSYDQWVSDSLAVLNELNGAYAIQFRNAHGSSFMGCPAAHSIKGCGYWQEIAGKTEALMDIITDLQKRH